MTSLALVDQLHVLPLIFFFSELFHFLVRTHVAEIPSWLSVADPTTSIPLLQNILSPISGIDVIRVGHINAVQAEAIEVAGDVDMNARDSSGRNLPCAGMTHIFWNLASDVLEVRVVQDFLYRLLLDALDWQETSLDQGPNMGPKSLHLTAANLVVECTHGTEHTSKHVGPYRSSHGV